MSELFRFSTAVDYMPEVDEWFGSQPHALYSLAQHWFGKFRQCGSDVCELIHDGCPVACVQDAAFGYVNVFKAHINVGFYTGAYLHDPAGLLEGTGKRMRHVKVRPDQPLDASALAALIEQAYLDVKGRL